MVYCKKKTGKKIIYNYLKIIYLHEVYLLQETELKTLEEQLEALELMAKIITIDTDSLKIKILNLKKEQINLLDEIEKIKIDLSIWCHLPTIIPPSYPCPFISFPIHKTTKLITKSLFFLKTLYALRQAEVSLDDFFPIISVFSNTIKVDEKLNKRGSITITKYRKIEELKIKLRKKIEKKYYRIHSYYKFFQVLKLQASIQEEYSLEIKKRLNFLEKNKNIQDVYEIYKLKFQLLHGKRTSLEQKYRLVLLVWDIFLELSPLDFCEKVYEIS